MLEKTRISTLIIDDSHESQVLALECLSNFKDVTLDKHTASSAKSGMEKFLYSKPDITFLDITLPDGDGLRMLADIHKKEPEAFVVMMTSSASPKHVACAKELGANGYILKPFSISRFRTAITSYFEYQDYIEGMTDTEKENFFVDIQDNIAFPEDKSSEGDSCRLDHYIHHWRILFVDAFAANRRTANRLLPSLGCQVDVAKNMQDVETYLNHHAYNLLFLDTKFPNDQTYKLVSQLRAKEEQQALPRAVCIAMFDTAHEKNNKRWLEVGMDDYLIRPCRFKDMHKKIRHHAEICMEEALLQATKNR